MNSAMVRHRSQRRANVGTKKLPHISPKHPSEQQELAGSLQQKTVFRSLLSVLGPGARRFCRFGFRFFVFPDDFIKRRCANKIGVSHNRQIVFFKKGRGLSRHVAQQTDLIMPRR
jgi:hypothetical protein